MEKYKIIYEDSFLYVIWKASGLPVQSARACVPDLMSMLRNRLLEKGVNAPYLAPVNRLDQPVEGLLLVAAEEGAAADLSRQAAGHIHMEKWYQALVCGKPAEKKGKLVDYLRKDGRTNTSRVVSEGTKDAKRCELSYEVQEEQGETSLLRIRLLSGMHHPTLLQLAHPGMPNACDRQYCWAYDGHRQLCLCACETAFVHPHTEERMRFRVAPSFLDDRK